MQHPQLVSSYIDGACARLKFFSSLRPLLL
jgi:hypothetical protein